MFFWKSAVGQPKKGRYRYLYPLKLPNLANTANRSLDFNVKRYPSDSILRTIPLDLVVESWVKIDSSSDNTSEQLLCQYLWSAPLTDLWISFLWLIYGNVQTNSPNNTSKFIVIIQLHYNCNGPFYCYSPPLFKSAVRRHSFLPSVPQHPFLLPQLLLLFYSSLSDAAILHHLPLHSEALPRDFFPPLPHNLSCLWSIQC